MAVSNVTVQRVFKAMVSFGMVSLERNMVATFTETYNKSSVEGKRYLISMLFQQKLTYENGTYRTLLMNEFAQHIYLTNNEL